MDLTECHLDAEFPEDAQEIRGILLVLLLAVRDVRLYLLLEQREGEGLVVLVVTLWHRDLGLPGFLGLDDVELDLAGGDGKRLRVSGGLGGLDGKARRLGNGRDGGGLGLLGERVVGFRHDELLGRTGGKGGGAG